MPARNGDAALLGAAGSTKAGVDTSTLVVAVDGPSGSGKSTVAREVAAALGLRYLDTGAMYRALTWWVLRQGVDPADEAAVRTALGTFDVELSTDPEVAAVRVHDHDVTTAIRSAEVTAAVSAVSAISPVRRRLVELQRTLIGRGGIAVEGRDIGTVVCPAAPVKIFLTASTDTRASRRALQIGATAAASDVDVVRAGIDRRDGLDSTRQTSPLRCAPDAVAIDSTRMSRAEVVAQVLEVVRANTGVSARSPRGDKP
jgi:cytidylate kinase